MFIYVLVINQRVVIVKNVHVGHAVAVVVKSDLGGLVVIAEAKSDHVDHAAVAEVKGIIINTPVFIYLSKLMRLQTNKIFNNFFEKTFFVLIIILTFNIEMAVVESLVLIQDMNQRITKSVADQRAKKNIHRHIVIL